MLLLRNNNITKKLNYEEIKANEAISLGHTMFDPSDSRHVDTIHQTLALIMAVFWFC